MMRPTCLGVLLAVLPVFFFAACLLEPKTGCRTRDDCAPGRVCVAGTCEPERRDAGLDARSDKQSSGDGATNLSERPNPDVASDPGGAPDLAPQVADVAPDAPIDAPNNLAGLDASLDRPSPDVASDQGGGPDLAPQLVDVASDAPATIDAPESPVGLDASSDNQFPGDVATDLLQNLSPDLAGDGDSAPDLAPATVDVAPDTPIGATIDVPPDSSPPASDTDAGHAQLDATGDLPPGSPSWDDFRTQTPREPWTGGRYIVDGDLPFDEAGLQRYYDAWFAAAGVSPENLAPMGATAVWPFPDSFLLSYCISTSFEGNFAAVEAAMAAATASWSDRVGVEFTYVPAENTGCDASDTSVTFDVRPVSNAGYAAVSFFPDSPRSARSLFVDTSAFAVGPGGVDLEGTLRHQLGHTLGFQHEHLWLDPACTTEDSRLAVKIANYDIDSVMHLPACRPSEIGGTIQTEGDFAGATAIYGLSPALIVVTGPIANAL